MGLVIGRFALHWGHAYLLFVPRVRGQKDLSELKERECCGKVHHETFQLCLTSQVDSSNAPRRHNRGDDRTGKTYKALNGWGEKLWNSRNFISAVQIKLSGKT